ncbi:MAG: SCO family protein, partial [Limisphaerales bacterium]
MSRSFLLLIGSGAALLLALMVLFLFVGRSARVQGPTVVFQSRTGAGVDSGPLPVLREIRDFSLTNQAGAPFSKADLAGGPWAVNLIFTRCPGPCTQLSGVMRSVQSALPAGSKARLLSLTSDPGFDTPEVLTRYAAKIGVDAGAAGWTWATGSKDVIGRLATG